MPASNAEANDGPAAGGIGPLKWFGLSLLAVSTLALAAAHVGGSVRVLLRFAPLFGLIGGAATGWFASYTVVSRRRAWIAAAAVLVACAYVGMTLEAYRMYVAELRELYTGGLPLLAPELAGPLKQERQKVLAARSRFATYLSFRVSGNRLHGGKPWREPWPAVFWGLEIMLAAVAGGWTFSRFARRPPTTDGTPGDKSVRDTTSAAGQQTPVDEFDKIEPPKRLHDDAEHG